jgi:serine/threonine protein phosphatase PrpC
MPHARTSPHLTVAGRTDIGRQRRHNEDHVLVKPDLGLFVVADGMGGHNAGNVASALTTTSLCNFFEATGVGAPVPSLGVEDDGLLSEQARRVVSGVRKANHDVFEISSTVQQHHGMGSTVVMAYVPPGSNEIHVAHVGDSRCYRIRAGIIRQLTSDHSLVCDALLMKPDLSHEELSRLPKNIITRALGMRDAVTVDIGSDEMLPGDIYLLCSDGLSGMVDDVELLEIVSVSEDLEEACELLITMANEAGGTDNISAVLVRMDEVPSEAIGTEDTVDGDGLVAAEPSPVALSEPPPGAAFDDTDPGRGERKSLEPQELLETVLREDEEAARAYAEVTQASYTPAPPTLREGGAVITAPLPVPMAFCNRCGFELFEGNLFCVECGVRIADDTIRGDA